MTGGRAGSASTSPAIQSASSCSSSSSSSARRRSASSSSARARTPQAQTEHLWATFEPISEPALNLGQHAWSVGESQFTVGRGTGNDLHLEKAAKCSGQHATLLKIARESPPGSTAAVAAVGRAVARLKDHSSNGTHVNGVKVKKADMIIRDGDVLVFGPLATPDNPFEISYRITYVGPPSTALSSAVHSPPGSSNALWPSNQVSSSSTSPSAPDANRARKRKRTPSPPVQLARVEIVEFDHDLGGAGAAEATQHANGTSPANEAATMLDRASSLDKPEAEGVPPVPDDGGISTARHEAPATKAPSPSVQVGKSLAFSASSPTPATTATVAEPALPSLAPDPTTTAIPITGEHEIGTAEDPVVATFRAAVAAKSDKDLLESHQSWLEFFSRNSRAEYEASNPGHAWRIKAIEAEVAVRKRRDFDEGARASGNGAVAAPAPDTEAVRGSAEGSVETTAGPFLSPQAATTPRREPGVADAATDEASNSSGMVDEPEEHEEEARSPSRSSPAAAHRTKRRRTGLSDYVLDFDDDQDVTKDESVPEADVDERLIALRKLGVAWPEVARCVGLSLGEAQARHQSALEAASIEAIRRAQTTTTSTGDSSSSSPGKRPTHWTRWSTEEDARFLELKNRGLTYKVIAQMIGRTESACQQRYKALKLIASGAGGQADGVAVTPTPVPAGPGSPSSLLLGPASPFTSDSFARGQSDGVNYSLFAKPNSRLPALGPFGSYPPHRQPSHNPTTNQAGPRMLPATSVQSMIEQAVETALRRREMSASVGPSGTGSVPPPHSAAPDQAEPVTYKTPISVAPGQKQETPVTPAASTTMSTSPGLERKPVVASAREADGPTAFPSEDATTVLVDGARQEAAVAANASEAADGIAALQDGAEPPVSAAAASTCTCHCHASHDDRSASTPLADPAVRLRVQQTMEEVSALLDRAGASFSRFTALRTEAKERESVGTVV